MVRSCSQDAGGDKVWSIQSQRELQHCATTLTTERRPFDAKRVTQGNDVAGELADVHRRAATWIIRAAMATEIGHEQAIVDAKSVELVDPKVTCSSEAVEQH